MYRRKIQAVVVLFAAATLVSACGSKSTDNSSGSGSSTASNLAFKPVAQVDANGKEVPAGAASTPVDPAGDGQAKCSGIKLAFAGPKTGGYAALGINAVNGAKVAIMAHNKANPGCQVSLAEFDTEADPQKATQVIPQMISDASIIGMVGPLFSGETKATGAIVAQAGLVSIVIGATNPALAKNGWKTFFRSIANDNVQGPGGANYMMNTLKYKKVCVVGDDTDGGVGLAKAVNGALGSVADSNCASRVKTGDKDFSSTVSQIKGESPDAIYYAGFYSEAAPFVAQLRSAGVTAPFVSDDGIKDPVFVKLAGSASKGVVASCPCGPVLASFATEYKALNNVDAGAWSAEGYDITTIYLKGIDAGNITRPALLKYVTNYDGDGLARHYKWDSTGELAKAVIWMYKVQ